VETLHLTVPVLFGTESIAADEIRKLGYDTTSVTDGKVTFLGDFEAVCVANINLRCGERVLIKLAEFSASSFDELFEGTKAIEWEKFIPKNGAFPVKGHALKSKLHSVPDCQSIVKKAIVERLKRKYGISYFEETGAKYQIQFSIIKDVVVLYIDTTGDSLHKRGYRAKSNAAPLRETIAYSMINLSRFRGDRLFLDPFCGSGTIAIEAAMYQANIAPGLNRHFASEKWNCIGKELWKDIRLEARENIKKDVQKVISASDIDADTIELAKNNAKLAGVDQLIDFSCCAMEKLTPHTEKGAIVCNPPYGERLMTEDECKKLYTNMGKKFTQFSEMNKYILTSYPYFEKYYGKSADKKRKIYNGMLKCDIYQYFKGDVKKVQTVKSNQNMKYK